MNNDWRTLNQKGKYGEAEAAQLLNYLGVQVKDVSGELEYQVKDIDFLCVDAFGNEASMEVKYDSRISGTGNLFLELRTTFAAGWWRITEADFLLYGDSVNKLFYLIRVDTLRNFLQGKTYRTITCPDFKNGTWLKDIIGQLVPIEDLVGAGVAKILKKEEEL